MYKTCRAVAKITLAFLLITAAQKASANINVIDFTKIDYPSSLQPKIDFLRKNDAIYDHWVHTWNSTITKSEVVENLTFLYTEIDKIQNENVETDLLLGDIAHYLYNMEVEEYYPKAVDNYKKAIAIAPKDYRVYWFLGTHYALSAVPVLAIETFKGGLNCLPVTPVNTLFWREYATACINASMPATARYAAHRISLAVGKREKFENDVINTTRSTLKAAPVDTTIKANNLWAFAGRHNSMLNFSNPLLGFKLVIDSTWKFRFGDYQNKGTFAMLEPRKETAQNGRLISYSMLIMAKLAADGQSLQQFMNGFTKSKNIKPVSFNVGQINNCIAYEIIDPTIYADMGGSHNYAIAFERTEPEFAGMLLENPMAIPKTNGSNVTYYRAPQRYVRVKDKIYYLILLDTCEDIHDQSLAVFKDFLKNGIVVE
jgi:hypothetical protein